jgi:hypothetical protein
MSEEGPEKKPRLVGWLLGTVLIWIVIVAILYHSPPALSSLSKTTSISTTTSFYASLQGTDFQMTNSSGCIFHETTGPYEGLIFEHFIVTVRNRFNETIHFVNVTIIVASVKFVDSLTSTKVFESMLVNAGPNDTAALTFPVNFPISGVYFGKPYTYVDYAPFDVIIYVTQNGQVQGPFWLKPELIAFPSTVPTC